MRQKGYLMGIGAGIAMVLLILDSRTAIAGAETGIELCMKTVIPSLFPFFVFSGMITNSLLGSQPKFLSPIRNLCGIPSGAESIFLIGLTGGYPVGARLIGDSCRSGSLTPEDGRRMIAFCNNAGPSFIFGMAAAMFEESWIPWVLWLIQITGSVITAMILPKSRSTGASVCRSIPVSLPLAVRSAAVSMANVCAWVVLFRVLLAFLERWILWLLPKLGQILIFGVLELSNGCCALDCVANVGMRFILCTGFLSFGGLCVYMQTVSAANGVDHSLYLPGKLMHTACSTALACLVQWAVPCFEKADHLPEILVLSMISLGCTAVILRKIQNNSRYSAPVGV